LVYATNGLINGQDREKNFRFQNKDANKLFKPVSSPSGMNGQAYELKVQTNKPLLFVPFYEAGGRVAGSWRLTWIQNEID
jgi:hypothetical protein